MDTCLLPAPVALRPMDYEIDLDGPDSGSVDIPVLVVAEICRR
jgi:hypothetical protein